MMHKLIVTKIDEVDGAEYTLAGPHDSSCRVWRDCLVQDAVHPEAEDVDYEPIEAHGVQHRWIDGYWMTPTNECGGYYDDDIFSLAGELGVGEHDVTVEYDGDGTWMVLRG